MAVYEEIGYLCLYGAVKRSFEIFRHLTWTGSVKGSRILFIALFPSRQVRTASLVPLSDHTHIGLTLHSGFSPPEPAVTKDDGLRRRNYSPT